MKYAVKMKGADLPYACVGCHPGPCGYDHERQPFFSDGSSWTSDHHLVTADHARAVEVAKARGGSVARVLSHEEAKRKAAAMALLALAKEFREAAPFYRKRPFESGAAAGLLDAARHAEAEAEKLWPVLFHAGDGRKPRGK